MDSFGWILWAALGILFITAEVFTFGFVLLWFGIGAILAQSQMTAHCPEQPFSDSL